MDTGTVKWFDEKKGYGFIEGQNGSDIFVHFSDIQEEGFRKLADGEIVEYKLLTGQKGPRATNVIRHKPQTTEQTVGSGNGGNGASFKTLNTCRFA